MNYEATNRGSGKEGDLSFPLETIGAVSSAQVGVDERSEGRSEKEKRMDRNCSFLYLSFNFN